jgi:hypothetical protein
VKNGKSLSKNLEQWACRDVIELRRCNTNAWGWQFYCTFLGYVSHKIRIWVNQRSPRRHTTKAAPFSVPHTGPCKIPKAELRSGVIGFL